MAAVTVTFTVGPAGRYQFTPQANFDTTTGTGLTLPDIVMGYLPAYTSPNSVSVTLDSSYTWDVFIETEGAYPVKFSSFVPAAGDLFEQLATAGWTPGVSS